MSFQEFNTHCLKDYFSLFFHQYSQKYHKSLSVVVMGMMHCISVSTGAIATAISHLSGKTFSAADKQIRYLLSNGKFQVDDTLWRCYLKLVFRFLQEGNYIKKGKKVFVQVDHTTCRNNFLILYASIVFRGKAVPIYFSLRLYPKHSGQLNQIKMEEAFIRSLRHILSKKYHYVIVADRGFGHQRFVQLCQANHFDYIVRLKENLLLKKARYNKLSDCQRNCTLTAMILSWSKEENLFISHKNGQSLYLCSSLDQKQRRIVLREYSRRFRLEGTFKDQKSSGFNIEKTKIKKYDRFKRLLFCMCIAQCLMLFTGDILKHNHHEIKKTFPESVALILAFSFLQNELSK